MIYFIQREDDNRSPVKIGYSFRPRQRLEGIQTCSPYQLIILATADMPRETETIIHEQFKESRMSGEWFKWTPELQIFIDGFVNEGDEPFKVVAEARLLMKKEPKFNPKQRKILFTIIERAFRRGFQHGFVAGTGGWGIAPTNEKVTEWRFKKITSCEYPPGTLFKGGSESLEERALTEIFMDEKRALELR